MARQMVVALSMTLSSLTMPGWVMFLRLWVSYLRFFCRSGVKLIRVLSISLMATRNVQKIVAWTLKRESRVINYYLVVGILWLGNIFAFFDILGLSHF